jgi:hypothetical protein
LSPSLQSSLSSYHHHHHHHHHHRHHHHTYHNFHHHHHHHHHYHHHHHHHHHIIIIIIIIINIIQEMDKEDAEFKALSNPLRICVTAADKSVCYSLLPALSRGDCFGNNTEVSLRLLGTPGCDEENIRGLACELMDMCDPLCRNIEVLLFVFCIL